METQNLSVFSLIAGADFLVQLVMLLLLCSSIFSWSIIFDKWLNLKKQIRKADLFEQYFWSGQVMENVYNNVKHRADSQLIKLFINGLNEFKRLHTDDVTEDVIVDKVKNKLAEEKKKIIDGFERNVDWLATIGSTAPFIGLLGTVWGIMNSFQAIAMTQNTTLAIVAPSIAEALLATAFGLLVAIPAVICYNLILIKISNFSTKIENFSVSFHRLLVQGLDEQKNN